jgi:3-deoxy-manno-octulosonate cytidylyltransferase (CMP-KDO synthetase)
MQAIGVIPARYASTRFEGKVLADISGKTMLQRVWEQARAATLLDDLIIACDDQRIFDAVQGWGARAVMTSKAHTSGTDRICEVINPLEVKIVINIQGDEPLIHPNMIDAVARALLNDAKVMVATLIKKITDLADVYNPHVVKVVKDKDDFALFFSRAEVPYHAENSEIKAPVYYKHIGLYGYTKDFLFIFKNLAPSYLEKTERLEQLRILEEGFRIKVVETEYDTVGVDTPEDLEKVRQIFAERGAIDARNQAR